MNRLKLEVFITPVVLFGIMALAILPISRIAYVVSGDFGQIRSQEAIIVILLGLVTGMRNYLVVEGRTSVNAAQFGHALILCVACMYFYAKADTFVQFLVVALALVAIMLVSGYRMVVKSQKEE